MLGVVARWYFSGAEDVFKFVDYIVEYSAFNKIADKNTYTLTNSSLKGDALYWLNTKYLITLQTERYEQAIPELKKDFTFKNVTAFLTEFYS